jgi:hypothetical protein
MNRHSGTGLSHNLSDLSRTHDEASLFGEFGATTAVCPNVPAHASGDLLAQWGGARRLTCKR